MPITNGTMADYMTSNSVYKYSDEMKVGVNLDYFNTTEVMHFLISISFPTKTSLTVWLSCK